jgi:hypothetical protein
MPIRRAAPQLRHVRGVADQVDALQIGEDRERQAQPLEL